MLRQRLSSPLLTFPPSSTLSFAYTLLLELRVRRREEEEQRCSWFCKKINSWLIESWKSFILLVKHTFSSEFDRSSCAHHLVVKYRWKREENTEKRGEKSMDKRIKKVENRFEGPMSQREPIRDTSRFLGLDPSGRWFPQWKLSRWVSIVWNSLRDPRNFCGARLI